jgi:hypothetical protein
MGAAWYGSGMRRLFVKFAGFGLSTILLAVVSLAATPAMVAANGPTAWGAIALGQALGLGVVWAGGSCSRRR